jgi:hypothetical protein
MDYNNTKSRLERVYSSINGILEEDMRNCIKVEHQENHTGKSIKISFDNNFEEAEAENKINVIIHNLANLKDHLKKKVKDGQDIENEINGSLYLQIVLDLSNQEKHGYPLTRIRRSDKDPRITNIRQSLRAYPNSSNSKISFFIDPHTGIRGTTNNCIIAINADVVDLRGDRIFDLDELIERAIVAWEVIIKKYNIN